MLTRNHRADVCERTEPAPPSAVLVKVFIRQPWQHSSKSVRRRFWAALGQAAACWSLSGVPEHKAQWRADIILELWRIKHQHSTWVTTWWWRPVPVVFYFSFCRSTRQGVICS